MWLKLPFRFGKRDAETPVMGDGREQLMDLVHGKHYADCLAGRVFSQCPTPLGLAIPIYTATAIAGGMPIWNPIGSNVNVELIGLNTGRASGVTDFATVGLMHRKVSQSSIATGAQITAFAETTPINGILGSGVASAVKSSNAGTCTITAGVAAEYIRNLFTIYPAIDTTATDVPAKVIDFDGTVILPPGGLIWIAATKASVALFTTSIVWKEIPL